jgi:hypothetical protein
MPKTRKKQDPQETRPARKLLPRRNVPIMPQVGDKAISPRSELVYEILRVSQDGKDVDLHVLWLLANHCKPISL